MNDITNIDTNNYALMAKAMGFASENKKSSAKTVVLPRFRIWHQPIMGQAKVNGKTANVEVVEGGSYRLEVPSKEEDGKSTFFFAKTAKFRVFAQRFMWRRFVANKNPKPNEPKGSFHRTLMADSLSADLKDNMGGFNCGKPSGYVKDFKALPQNMQDLLRQIRKVRVLFGYATLIDSVDSEGKPIKVDTQPVIWEIDNRNAVAHMGEVLTQIDRKQRLPIQHTISLVTEKNELPNGTSYYTPNALVDFNKSLDITDTDQSNFKDFMEYIKNYNEYINTQWSEKSADAQPSKDDMKVVESFVDIDDTEVA
tara:strand:+ start:430 stop:1359 length:930 start_codon:yes stop_codon:yes gene_type:complete